MPRLTHKRSSGIKTGYWSPARKEELISKLGPIEELGPGLIANICDRYCICVHSSSITQGELDELCAKCPAKRLADCIK